MRHGGPQIIVTLARNVFRAESRILRIPEKEDQVCETHLLLGGDLNLHIADADCADPPTGEESPAAIAFWPYLDEFSR
ncbi:hypothetical protein N801_08880 [Knoellia aerolata DSM 18566]|uniref:Uncharacterized protein n=1 Tax=Knoellia aerolata DSM 18566 TaxID=1385519 RepID=A0A0A0K076_9MICO|nr:hypothetical protein N801_08880 [Knoellia aerolata DSM 18566]